MVSLYLSGRSRRSLSLCICLSLVALDAHYISLSIYSAPEPGAADNLDQLGFARRARRRTAPGR